jgi:hypothetical protein
MLRIKSEYKTSLFNRLVNFEWTWILYLNDDNQIVGSKIFRYKSLIIPNIMSYTIALLDVDKERIWLQAKKGRQIIVQVTFYSSFKLAYSSSQNIYYPVRVAIKCQTFFKLRIFMNFY